MDESVALCDKFIAWRNSAPTGHSSDEEEGAALEDAAMAAHWKTRAFSAHGSGQMDMCRSADYTDEWFGTPDKKFRCYYVCMAKSGWGTAAGVPAKCGHIILSKAWGRALSEPWAAGQRWYCTICGARYCPKYGVLVEMAWGGASYYCLAAFPPHDIRDVKWMAVQERLEKYQSPLELFNALPTAVPMPYADFITHVKGDTYKFDVALMATVPMLEWSQLYNLKPREGQAAAEPRPKCSKRVATSASLSDYEVVDV